MRSLLILFIVFILVTGCNSDSKTNTKDDKTGTDVSDDRKDDKGGPMENKDKNSKYEWTVTDQNKFLEDCRRESEENVPKEKLKDFCSCMLTQAQKYYPDYRQMDEKSDEDDDGKIFGECLANYGGEQ